MAKVVLIHTVAGLEHVFGPLCDEVAPGLAPSHVVDESLLNDTIAAGALTDEVRARFRARAEQARAEGADVIMLTCSSVGPAADNLGEELGVTVLRVDEAMAERAVALGDRVGVAATLPTTLEPTADLVRRAADRAGRVVDVTTELASGAFQALKAGDAARHDELVRAALRTLAARVDVIVLAQASMARALAGADSVEADGRRVPVLTSPRLGVERLSEVASGQ
ncbi:MAG: aspartate/glutamate racemase family protein [Chloroflexota bacterium]|nr:aspartate/glutamate racemase family protein [Chloroflexota bacterium]